MYTLKDFGSFLIEGRKVQISGQPVKTVSRNADVSVEINPNGDYAIENMYVQYFIPEKAEHSVILVHGGGQTGAIWEGTPDGREGWLQFYLKQNFSVYIVDTVERGRSGWCPLTEFWPEKAELRNDHDTWMTFRLGEVANFNKRLAFDNIQFPMQCFDQMLLYNVPRWNHNNESSATALAKLIARIGNCSIIAHSQGCGIAMQAVAAKPSFVHKVVLLEPASFYNMNFIQQLGLEVLILFGDNIAKSQFWTQMKELAVDYVKELNQKHIIASLQDLPDIGINGNSHAMMLDKNNLEVAKYVLDWINL